MVAAVLAFGAAGCGDDGGDDDGGSCEPDDFDGIDGGKNTFVVTVTDTAFTPSILTTQNEAQVTLTLTNEGTVPHGFVIDCLPTPNDDGCPQESCFPEESKIEPIEPGETREIEFETPDPEGIYEIHSVAGEDSPAGQFVIR